MPPGCGTGSKTFAAWSISPSRLIRQTSASYRRRVSIIRAGSLMHAPITSKARPWLDEAGATVSLAGPLILTNLAQSAINATDVLLLGWLGARQLAAAAIGVNL